ncbi:MAG: hypothetical protein M9943_08605 [Burkholderiaceae bacterium]|nr:hypothetical protein [Burkholderiaceae bacterium]
MNPPSISTFGAAGSMVGYLYQVRLGLLWAIRRSRTSDFTVSIETLDDVSFEVGGQPDAVLQTKHSLNAAANLTDLSPEVWKTLRIWLVGLASGEIPPETARFLISTADAPAGSACAALCVEEAGRDVAEAAKRLKHAATSSTNNELKDAFEAFLGLDEVKRGSTGASMSCHPSPMLPLLRRSCSPNSTMSHYTIRLSPFRCSKAGGTGACSTSWSTLASASHAQRLMPRSWKSGVLIHFQSWAISGRIHVEI